MDGRYGFQRHHVKQHERKQSERKQQAHQESRSFVNTNGRAWCRNEPSVRRNTEAGNVSLPIGDALNVR